MIDPSEIPVFMLCGGFGTRLKEETETRPKPMVPLGGRPILWHIMRLYAQHGFRRFVLCLGYRADVIKSYFLNYYTLNSDFTVDLRRGETTIHPVDHDFDWEVTLADTGEGSMTGSRVAQAAQRYLAGAPLFAVTYGDGLTDADLGAELAFHAQHGKIGTLLAVNPPTRFGELLLDGSRVCEFNEKPEQIDGWINGGFFFFRSEFLRYLSLDPACILERRPLVDLARDDELRVYQHQGFWACMDTQRDREHLDALWAAGKAPWAPSSLNPGGTRS